MVKIFFAACFLLLFVQLKGQNNVSMNNQNPVSEPQEINGVNNNDVAQTNNEDNQQNQFQINYIPVNIQQNNNIQVQRSGSNRSSGSSGSSSYGNAGKMKKNKGFFKSLSTSIKKYQYKHQGSRRHKVSRCKPSRGMVLRCFH